MRKNTPDNSTSAHHGHLKHKTFTKHTIRVKHLTPTHIKTIQPTTTFSVTPPTLISERTILNASSPTPIAEGTILTGSSLPTSSSASVDNTPMIIGGVIGGIVMISSILCYVLHRRIKRKKSTRSTVIIRDEDSHQQGEKWAGKGVWSTLGSTTSSKSVEMDTPPPAYCITSRAKKRLTLESDVSKQSSSLFKQYSPQLAYSPSHHTALQIDQDSLSPSHTLIDTRPSSFYLQHNPLEKDDQQRRSLQPYPTLLDITPSSP